MAYLTLADFKAELGENVQSPGLYDQMTDRLAATTANDVIGQSLVDGACAEIDQILAQRYAVPIDTTDQAVLAEFLKQAALTIATWNGWSLHPVKSKNRETVRTRYEDWIAKLRRIAEGDASLPSTGTLAQSVSDGADGEAVGDDRVFDGESMVGW